MSDDGHFIDDPLFVANVKPDFSNLGLHPIHPNGMTITLKDIIGDVPYWIKFLPKDWKGETGRAYIKFAVSKLAIENAKFDMKVFVSAKFVNGLRVIMKKHGWSEICLTDRFTATIDAVSESDRTYFIFHVEFAKNSPIL